MRAGPLRTTDTEELRPRGGTRPSWLRAAGKGDNCNWLLKRASGGHDRNRLRLSRAAERQAQSSAQIQRLQARVHLPAGQFGP